jgi:hypothetical protein
MRKNIFGLIGYTVLKCNDKLVLIMADRHDNLPPCNVDYNKVSDWLKSKFDVADILLEEVKRTKNNVLGELWATSEHTQDLKNLYLDNANNNVIKPIDIRNNYIPYSWELYDKNEIGHNIIYYQFLSHINKFFSLKDEKLKAQIPLYNINYLKHNVLGIYFLLIKYNYKDYVEKYKHHLYANINDIIDNKKIFLEFNDILHSILEWYAIAETINSTKNKIIIHTGLAHSEKIVYYLQRIFNYEIIDEQGTNTIGDLTRPVTSCFLLPSEIAAQFGGFRL